MRKGHALTGLALLGAGLLGWAAVGLAQTGSAIVPVATGAVEPAPYTVPTPGAAGSTPVPTTTPGPLPGSVRPSETNTHPETTAKTEPTTDSETAQPAHREPAANVEATDSAVAPADASNPTGRQEPAVSLEWIGPATAKVGQPADYSIVVRNACNIPVQQVMVRARLPQGITISGTEPKAVTEDNVLMWELGTLMPKQEKTMIVRMVAAARGDVPCQAWVTFTGASALRVRVREPKLLLKASAPDKVLVGDAATFMLTVSNPGDHMAEMVKIHAHLTEGLEHARGNKIDFDLGNLGPGETRSVQVICATKAGGGQTCEAFAEADGGLKATDKASVNVIMPQINLEVAGPRLRYLDRKAEYVFKVTNPGDAPATNVVLSHILPQGFKYLTADNGGRHDFATRTVQWFLGEVGPGQSREVKMQVLAVNPGEFHMKGTAQASRGLRVEGEVSTRVEGLSAILIEVVDLEDPVEVNGETTYEIRITNTGSKTETDVKLVCSIPVDKMQFKSAQGPQGLRFHAEGSQISFDNLPKLAPRADAIYRVTVKTLAPGQAKFHTQITSTNLTDPVIKEESTRIYED